MTDSYLGTLSQPHWIRPMSTGGRAILDLLVRRGSMAQAEFPRILDLSQSSVARLIGEFAREGQVTLASRRAAGPGNPSVTVQLNPDFAFSLGVSIVGDAVSMAAVDLTGRVRGYRSTAMADMTPRLVLDQLQRVKADLLRETGIDPARIVGAGVGLSAYFVGDPPRFSPPPLLDSWEGVDVVAILHDALNVPVLCDNDANAAALYECLVGVGRHCQTFAYCHLTNGFGGGIVIDGRLVRSWMGNAGNFGGVWWLLDGGFPNLDRMRHHVNVAGSSFETVEDMVRAVTPATPGIDAWLEEAVGPFGMLTSILGHVISPQKVVIGGRIPRSIATALSQRIHPPATPDRNGIFYPLPTIVTSEVDGDSVAAGAAMMPLQRIFF